MRIYDVIFASGCFYDVMVFFFVCSDGVKLHRVVLFMTLRL